MKTPFKKVLILQGISGSGKSTFAKQQPNAVVVSADFIHYKDGVYAFDESRLSVAHNTCMLNFTSYMLGNQHFPVPAGVDTLIVDNTNTRALFMAPYIAVARALDVEVEIHSFRVDPEVAAARNDGRAPLSVVKSMADQIENFHMPVQWTRDGVKYIIHGAEKAEAAPETVHDPRKLPVLKDQAKLDRIWAKASSFSRHTMFNTSQGVAKAAVAEYLANVAGFTLYEDLAKKDS